MPDLYLMELTPEQWNSRAQVMFSMALFDELLDSPERLSDPAFVGYLVGALGPNAEMSRDMFISVAVLGLNTSLSAYIGMRGEIGTEEEPFFTPEDLEMPPAIATGLNMQYLRSRDHARDEAKYHRLMLGNHLEQPDEERVAVARAVMLALSAQSVPPEYRANLLCLASFLQWMEGDQEGAGLNVILASMNHPGHRLASLLSGLYASDGEPLWLRAQRGREEAV